MLFLCLLDTYDSPVDDSDLDADYQPSFSDESSDSNRDVSNSEQDADDQEETENNGVEVVKTRKRKRNEKNWKCNIRKQRRLAGLSYVSKNKKNVREKKLKDKCKETCKLKCFNNFSDAERESIFNQFWSSSVNTTQKRQFVASCITIEGIKRRRERTGQKQRHSSYHYTFLKHNQRTRVCKMFFLNTLHISQTFVETALSKRTSEGGVVMDDFRGKHTPSNKINDDIRNEVRTHILKFPVQESHYRREKTSKKYLDSNLSINKMYELYVEECQEQKVPKDQVAKLWLYSDIFNTEFNYSFKKPVNDTCDSCDSFQVKLREVSCAEEKQQLRENYDKHLLEASKRYDLKKFDKERSLQDPSTKVLMIDLEKCLPTPVLTNAQSFYSLKLWTFNYTIHDATDKKTYCCMWDESVGGRGANEMASCFFKWLETVPLSPTVKKLVIWSDNCPSQNRNGGMVMCYLQILKKFPQLQVIEHKFLLRGHTHLEADSAHSLIERQWRKETQFKIMVPWDWQQLVRICNKKNPFTVISMEQENFKNFKSLYEGANAPYLLRKKSTSGDLFLISHAVILRVESDKPGILHYKSDYDNNNFLEVDFNRNRRIVAVSNNPINLPQVDPPPISMQKYKHLQNLLKWVPKMFHPFYNNIPHSERVANEESQ